MVQVLGNPAEVARNLLGRGTPNNRLFAGYYTLELGVLNRNDIMTRRRVLLVYVICVHLALVLALVKSDFGTRLVQRWRGKASPAASGELTEHYNKMLQYHKRMDANIPDNAAVFIGDSLTQGLCVDAITTPAVNFGIGSDTTVGVLRRLPHYRALERASLIVIEIGVNDMQYRENGAIMENYSQILDGLPRKARIIVSAVLPIEEKRVHTGDRKPITNDRIRNLNSGLATLCKQYPDRCLFVDIGDKLLDQRGQLAPALSDSDGIHLNSEGNKVWIEGLKKAATALRQKQ